MDGDFGIGLFMYLSVSVIVFFVCRELFCWYWKVNEVVTLLKSIDSKLGQMGCNISKSELLGLSQSDSTSDEIVTSVDEGYWNSSGNWVEK